MVHGPGRVGEGEVEVQKNSLKLANKKREQAAQLLAEDRFTDAKIAELCGISERALAKWKLVPQVEARVAELTAAYGERALKFGLARREKRLTVLNQLYEGLVTVIAARSRDPQISLVAGGSTGLLNRTVRGLSKTEVFEFDSALMRELRAVLADVAKEVGQSVDRREILNREEVTLEDVLQARRAAGKGGLEDATEEELDGKITELVKRLEAAKANGN